MEPTARQLWARIWDLEEGDVLDSLAALDDDEFNGRAHAAIAPDAPIVFITPDGGFLGAMGDKWRGADGLRGAWAEWLSGYDEWLTRIEEVEEIGTEHVLLLVDCSARLTGSTQPIEVRAGAIYTARDGLIVKVEHFLDQEQARRAAGIDPREREES